jgi:hypothetical protein
MIRSELKLHINTAYRGSDDVVPAAGSDDATSWDLTINRKTSEWASDSKNIWSSLFEPTSPNEPGTVTTVGTTALTGIGTYFLDYQIGDKITVAGETERTIDAITSNTALTVTVAFANSTTTTFTHKNIIKSGVQTYNLHRRFVSPSDVVNVGDNILTITKPQEAVSSYDDVYISGKNPKKITFIDDITSTSNLLGLDIQIPGTYMPADMTADTDTIPVDDPYWLVMAVAAELAFNDLTYEDKSAALNVKANALYQGMVANNRKGTASTPRKAKYIKSSSFSLSEG